MNKSELIASVSNKSGTSKKQTEKVLATILDTIRASVRKGEKVQLIGFGTFERRSRKARKGRDPRTKKEIHIPATKVPVFKAGKGFKDAVAGR